MAEPDQKEKREGFNNVVDSTANFLKAIYPSIVTFCNKIKFRKKTR